jgi:hypothetical protein
MVISWKRLFLLVAGLAACCDSGPVFRPLMLALEKAYGDDLSRCAMPADVVAVGSR